MGDVREVPEGIRAWLWREGQRLKLELVVTKVEVFPDCRVYYWNSAAAAEGSTKPEHLLAGGGPFIEDQEGLVWRTGSAYPIETWLSDFRGDRRLVRPLVAG